MAGDEEDFRKGASPLPEPRRVVRSRARPAPLPRETWRDALAESLGPIPPDEVVEGQLDLHGMNRSEAAAAMREFLQDCRARRLGCVRIVHGKGPGSRNREPVLKGKIRHWLKMREEVLAFSQAPAAHGGAGAVLVLLKT